MKKTIKYLAILAVLFNFYNCEEDLIIFSEDSFIQLDASSDVALTENGGVGVTVTALLGAPQANAITVNFDVSGTAAASRYTLSPGTSITIPAGETSGSVTLTPIDNDDIDGDATVTLALSSSSSLPVGIGGEGVYNVSRTITIVDDNVPCNDYVLNLTTDAYGEETFWDILDASGNTVHSGGIAPYPSSGYGSNTTINIDVPLEDGCYTLRVFDFWGDNGATFTLVCGSLTAAVNTDGLSGIPGLDASTVPAPGFRNGGTGPNYVGFAESYDFCVNQ